MGYLLKPKQELKLRGYDQNEYLMNNVVFMEISDYLLYLTNRINMC
jgi:hypothetical protein